MRFDVASAFAPVSPRGSAPSVELFLLRRGPVTVCELDFAFMFVRGARGGNISVFVEVDIVAKE